jgi:hypothetical protein
MNAELHNKDTTVVDKQILEFFHSANQSLVRKKLEKYGLLNEEDVGSRIVNTKDDNIGGSTGSIGLIDLLPIELTRNHMKSRLKCRLAMRKSI